MQLKKLVLLIDFHGHPVLDPNDHDNNVRYAHLREMMFRSKPEWIIMSDHHPKDLAIQEIPSKRSGDNCYKNEEGDHATF